MSAEEAELRIESCLVRLRAHHPFFGALALFVEHQLDDGIPTAATDGRRIRFNPGFISHISPRELDGVMVHELLHASLRHPNRRANRESLRWNVAADIVVNGMIREIDGLELPFKPMENQELKDEEVEEVYERLPSDDDESVLESRWRDLDPEHGEDTERRSYWASAFSQARMLAGTEAHGTLPEGLRRKVSEILEPKLDWRSVLWRFLARNPVDFEGYDRRFIGSGFYLDDLQGEQLKARVCIDTSASIGHSQLSRFLAELRAIIAAYPHLDLQVYYADARLYGPFGLSDEKTFEPQGGGGTDFRPFFSEMERDDHEHAVLIYFTDGYGDFPAQPPHQDVLWMLTTSSSVTELAGFGEACEIG